MLFGSYFENEFSKSVTAKQRSKLLFTGLKSSSAIIKNFNMKGLSASQIHPFQGSSLRDRPREAKIH